MRCASLDSFSLICHNDPQVIYELPSLVGANSPLKAIRPNRTFGYISVTKSSPIYNRHSYVDEVRKEERRAVGERRGKIRRAEKEREREKGGFEGRKGWKKGKEGKGQVSWGEEGGRRALIPNVREVVAGGGRTTALLNAIPAVIALRKFARPTRSRTPPITFRDSLHGKENGNITSQHCRGCGSETSAQRFGHGFGKY